MSKAKTPALESAQMSPEELDEFIADIRLPQLHRERNELTRRLADLFTAIGHEADWDWQPDNTANEVTILLTGCAAPSAEQSMPLPALHAALQRRRNAIDKAIALAMRAAQRVADRRLEQRIAENLLAIHAIARERALLALRLQKANRRLFEMEKRLGVGPFGLPSSGADLLRPGWAGDEVAVLVDALVTAGIVSRKDVLNAAQ
jgi:hypothetical protein